MYGAYASGMEAQARGKELSQQYGWTAEQVRQRGEQEFQEILRNSRRMEGANVAAVSAGNVSVTTGSPLLAIMDQVATDEKNAAMAKNNALYQALSLTWRARGARRAGESAARMGLLQSIGIGLSSAGTYGAARRTAPSAGGGGSEG